jgi:hypothetical protein
MRPSIFFLAPRHDFKGFCEKIRLGVIPVPHATAFIIRLCANAGSGSVFDIGQYLDQIDRLTSYLSFARRKEILR